MSFSSNFPFHFERNNKFMFEKQLYGTTGWRQKQNMKLLLKVKPSGVVRF